MDGMKMFSILINTLHRAWHAFILYVSEYFFNSIQKEHVYEIYQV